MRHLILILFLITTILLPIGSYLLAEDESINYPDKAGRKALQVWNERERDRAMAEAIRRYWDYWLSGACSKYSFQGLWFDLEQTQKWLKDPKHHPPPPLPPGHWVPPAYPYYPYYPYNYAPNSWSVYSWYPPPYYYPEPQGQNCNKD